MPLPPLGEIKSSYWGRRVSKGKKRREDRKGKGKKWKEKGMGRQGKGEKKRK